MNRDPVYRSVEIKTKRTKTEVKYKAGVYADDVHAVCGGKIRRVLGVLEQYETLTHRSGLELNS
jgi:hypothetical protein